MSAVFAVCDLETAYAVRLMEFLNRRHLPFELQFFTSPEPLCAYAEKKKIELLLISERAMSERIRALPVGKLILLSEDREQIPEGVSSVYKYQSSSQVIREVMDCYSAEQAVLGGRGTGRESRMTGVYGFSDPVERMLFSLTLGQILAETQSVLLLHLQKYTGFLQLTEETAEATLSDLLYFCRQGRKDMAHRIAGMVRQIGKLEYIPAPFFSEDLGEMSGAQWCTLLQELRSTGGYDHVLLDLGDGVRGLADILKQCTDCLLLSGEEAFTLHRRHLLEEELGLDGAGCRWLDPPSFGGIRQGRWFLESLPVSHTGDFIRQKVL